MIRTAVQFGAGNIGRGFVGQLFHESGLEVVFVDVAAPMVEALNRRHGYTIHVVGDVEAEVRVDGVRAVDGRDVEAVARELVACEIACTAVGAGALPHLAPGLAAGLLLRYRQGGGPLNVLICENLHDANTRLRENVAEHLPEADREAVLARTGFVQAVVSRMVPLQASKIENRKSKIENRLAIRVEAYKRLPVDAAAVVGALPEVVGVEPVANFLAHVERKLYTHNCAHATIGYLGWQAGCAYGYEAMDHPEVSGTLAGVLEETGAALIRRHGFDSDEHAAHVADLLARFRNRALGDTCFRLARDPLRKLAPDDRLVGAARLCEAEGVAPAALAEVIAAALRFDTAGDPSSVELQKRIRAEGVAGVLRSVCHIVPDEPLGSNVLSHCPADQAGA